MTSINIRKLSHSEMDLYRKPLLPETWSCFPVDRDIDTQLLRKILQKDLDKIRSGAEKDPFSNSITMLALDISRRLEKKSPELFCLGSANSEIGCWLSRI